MAGCDYCGEGSRGRAAAPGGRWFCSNQCRDSGKVLEVLDQIPASRVNARIDEAHRGPCPECNTYAPIDFHKSYKAYSVIVATTWKTENHVCCRRCARRHQWKAIGFTAGLGWWGVPWGFVATPVQIGRNLVEMCKRWNGPSFDFVRVVRLNFARSVAATNQASGSFKQPGKT
jgi:hypothetical protein